MLLVGIFAREYIGMRVDDLVKSKGTMVDSCGKILNNFILIKWFDSKECWLAYVATLLNIVYCIVELVIIKKIVIFF